MHSNIFPEEVIYGHQTLMQSNLAHGSTTVWLNYLGYLVESGFTPAPHIKYTNFIRVLDSCSFVSASHLLVQFDGFIYNYYSL